MTKSNGLFIDHYKRLGIENNASQDEVKKAFRKLAKLTHPDKSTGNKFFFLNIYASYEVLVDTKNRQEYDEQYHEYFSFFKNLNQQINQQKEESYYKKIPSSRIKFPTSLSTLLAHGLIGKKIKSRHIRYFLGINHDMELYLKEDEFKCPIMVELPVTARAICPQCMGSNPHCLSCKGVGSYKTDAFVKLKLIGGIFPGFVVQFDLRSQKPERPGGLFHFKKNKLLIKTLLYT